jgi:hypothetical protein
MQLIACGIRQIYMYTKSFLIFLLIIDFKISKIPIKKRRRIITMREC